MVLFTLEPLWPEPRQPDGKMRVWKLWKPLHVESYWLPLLQRCPRLQDLHAAVGADLELVGRLDKDSDGLLLLTTNASLRAALLGTESITRERGPTSSSHGSTCSKIYRVRTSFPMSDEQLEQLATGVPITTLQRRRGGKKITRPTLPCVVERDASVPSGKVLHITLREGRNRQIRKMIGSFGHRVATLRRLVFGGVSLEGLENAGDVAALTEAELAVLPRPADSAHFPWRQRLCDEGPDELLGSESRRGSSLWGPRQRPRAEREHSSQPTRALRDRDCDLRLNF